MSGIEMERDAESIEKMKKVKREFSATVSKGRIFVAAAQLWPDLLPQPLQIPAVAGRSRGSSCLFSCWATVVAMHGN